MTKREKRIRICGVVLCEAVTVYTIAVLITSGNFAPDHLLLALGTLVLVLLPAIAEKMLHCRLCLPLYMFALFYAVGPMFGQCWKLYYLTCWWDKMLHIFGGIVFAIVGAFVFERLFRVTAHPAAILLGALCFSIAISVLWEFVEFGADQLLGMDMQNDTVITGIHSYLLGTQAGQAAGFAEIQRVVIDGTALPFAGYLDIGLIDTMWDMLLESLGALITCVLLFLDKGRHPLIFSDEKEAA